MCAAPIDYTFTLSEDDTFAPEEMAIAVNGGEGVVITALEAQSGAIYSVDGRLVRKLNVTEGTTRVALPAGVYVVNNTKVVVY